MSAWMQTYTGRPWHFESPTSATVRIEDIAHALSNLCRFGGHCRKFYSVAEHSVLVSRVVPPAHAFAGLMHDATEAYVVDVPRPLKHLLSNYKEIEAKAWDAICAKFDIYPILPDCVHQADNAMLMSERHEILAPGLYAWMDADWDLVAAYDPELKPDIRCLPPGQAEQLFLNRFKELTK